MRIYRLDPKTGEKLEPTRYRDGCYRLADPNFGSDRHLDRNAVKVPDIDTVVDLVISRGHSVRVGPKASLVRRNLFVDGRKVT